MPQSLVKELSPFKAPPWIPEPPLAFGTPNLQFIRVPAHTGDTHRVATCTAKRALSRRLYCERCPAPMLERWMWSLKCTSLHCLQPPTMPVPVGVLKPPGHHLTVSHGARS
eukprot:GHUV01019158.1.p4 GENE.GHUV01019158.1~~GHUV01019158.1.p4  ORF type:complete len:111 (+),score=9.92 GHUV01019158.1:274-606(+)